MDELVDEVFFGQGVGFETGTEFLNLVVLEVCKHLLLHSTLLFS